MRTGLTASVVVTAVLWGTPNAALAQAVALPRTPDGKPNLQGIWEVINTAAWDVQDHSARLGMPAGQGVVVGNDIPYQPWALDKKRQNSESRATADPGVNFIKDEGLCLAFPAQQALNSQKNSRKLAPRRDSGKRF